MCRHLVKCTRSKLTVVEIYEICRNLVKCTSSNRTVVKGDQMCRHLGYGHVHTLIINRCTGIKKLLSFDMVRNLSIDFYQISRNGIG
jgi:hypothetical protein